ncbi:MAG: hypothetical protein OXR73_26295 [Myxococcales bacterium]|nr:hypothetical protein [Myxococcales bacterium]
MTGFHGFQVAIAAIAVAIAWSRVRALSFRANLDADAFLKRLRELVAADIERARTLCERAMPAWVARMAVAEIAAQEAEADSIRDSAVAELVDDLRQEAGRGIQALVTIGRAASPLAFVGVMLELGMAFQGDHGLAGLQRGLVEQIAMQNAVVGVALGLTTSTCCFMAAGSLRSEARRRLREVARVSDVFGCSGDRG